MVDKKVVICFSLSLLLIISSSLCVFADNSQYDMNKDGILDVRDLVLMKIDISNNPTVSATSNSDAIDAGSDYAGKLANLICLILGRDFEDTSELDF